MVIHSCGPSDEVQPSRKGMQEGAPCLGAQGQGQTDPSQPTTHQTVACEGHRAQVSKTRRDKQAEPSSRGPGVGTDRSDPSEGKGQGTLAQGHRAKCWPRAEGMCMRLHESSGRAEPGNGGNFTEGMWDGLHSIVCWDRDGSTESQAAPGGPLPTLTSGGPHLRGVPQAPAQALTCGRSRGANCPTYSRSLAAL